MTDHTVAAVLGAGGLGCCAALELADRGYRVHLFERRSQLVMEASCINEGKIHLGLVYAKDSSMRTVQRMLDGALTFEAYLQRWIPITAADVLSTPFFYGVHNGSLQTPDQLMAHYHKCAAYYDEQARRTGLDYLGLGVGIQFRQLAADEIPAVLNPAYFPAVIETSEYSVDARAIASMLRDAVVAHPGIIPYTDHEVTGIEENRDGSLNVTMLHDGSRVRDKFPAVVNATWHRRLPLDRPMGITPRGSWSHRYKFGHRINICLEARDVPSVTGVLGPFGDLVNFGNGGLYLSWYPTSRTGMSSEEVPPDWDAQYDREQRMAVFHASVAEWKRRCGLLDKLRFEESEVDPDGGVIYALGTTDVDDHASRLHARFDVGIQSRGRYHSVDTGKYTLMPYLGVAVADRLQGIR